MDRLTDVAVEKDKALDGIIRSSEKSQHQGATMVSGGSIAVEKEARQDGIVKSGAKAAHQGSTLVSGGSIAVEKEARQDGILKSAERAQYGGAGFGAAGSIAVEKEERQDGIVKSGAKAAHQGSTLVSGGSIAVEKEVRQDGILKSAEKAAHQGAGFGAAGSIAVEKEARQDGIVKSGAKAAHQGSGFASMGSIAVEKEVRQDGIVRGGGPVNTGPISSSADEIKQKIAEKIEGKRDPALEAAVRGWIEAATGKPVGENLQEALSDGQLLCQMMNLVYPKSIPKVQKGKMAFHKRENISSFCKQLEIRQFAVTFQPEDLIDGTNMPKVVEVLSDVCKTGKRRDPSLPDFQYSK